MAKMQITIATLTCTGLAAAALAGGGGWVEYEDESSTRMISPSGVGLNDSEEKDYAWGDVDQDGDIDLIVVRKQPFTSTGKRRNVLFMNEGIDEGHSVNGVLVDRTEEYASASDVPGDEGFLTPTNDRDVILVDVDNDGWLDMVTAPTLTDNQAKHLSHPRVYMNLGEKNGEWLGFEYQDARIPLMHPNAGPRFCSVASGDVNGDGYDDLWFGDYDSGGSQIFDFNNRLFINEGAANPGHFVDESSARMTSQMTSSNFGAASAICDMNGDGVNDCVKQTSLAAPTVVAIIYNNPDNEGFFNIYQQAYTNAAYFVSVGDLNNDGLLDMVIVDDGTDRYMLNTGNNSQGEAQFNQLTFPGSNGFGGNSVIADLNNDGFEDVIITDVDVDIPGCSRVTNIYRNLGDMPNVTMQEQGQVIPDGMLTGVHDAAVFDINGDGWLDIVMGRCNGTEVWMNQPPVGIVYHYPEGLPGFVAPGAETKFQVEVEAFGGGTPEEGAAEFFYSLDGDNFVQGELVHLGSNLYEATLPAVECTESVQFYFSAPLENGPLFFDPPNAPGSAYTTIGATGTDIMLRDEIEEDVSDWLVYSENLAAGEWEQAEPNGTVFNGEIVAPDSDATQAEDAVMAFVTQNGEPGAVAGASDVDGGPTYLETPMFDLEGTDGTVSFARWFRSINGDPDEMVTQVSNDNGKTWTTIPELAISGDGTGGEWEVASFVVSSHVEPTGQMRVRFAVSDQPNDGLTEAGIDNFQVEVFTCGDDSCPADIAGDDSMVNTSDLLELLGNWGSDGAGADIAEPADLVDTADLLGLLAAWGDCE